MEGSSHNFLANPLGVIQSTFETALSAACLNSFSGNDCCQTDLFRHFFNLYAYFECNSSFLQTSCSYNCCFLQRERVPLLNLKSIRWLQPGMLVRFRGMILDTLGSEFYVGAYKDGDVWRTNKYADVSKYCSRNYESDIHLWRRWLIYCIPVPGQNDWTEPSGPCMNLKTSGDKKRQRDEDAVMEDANELDLSGQAEEFPCPKRMREGDTATSFSSLQGVPAEGVFNVTMVPSEVDIESLSCLVKIYHFPASDLKLNDVFEFVGILAFDLPPGKAPRLHCLVHRKLLPSDFLPGPVSLEPKPQLMKLIRDALLAHLTSLFGNDGVTAQFMLLHLLSSVRERKDTVAVGKLALNLISLTNESISVFKNRILSILKNLLPFTHDLPLTVELLNAGPLVSRKDNESKRLVPGVLQLANGSHLTIDETQLDVWSLDSTGIDNARVLKSLLECRKVDHDLIPVDVHLLILSEGNSNILPADLVLPFRPSSPEGPETPNADALAAWRWYLATMGSLTYSIDHDMQKVLKDDIQATHQIHPSFGTLDSSRLLTMASLVSVSFGETSLLMEHWQMVKELDRLRIDRLQGRL